MRGEKVVKESCGRRWGKRGGGANRAFIRTTITLIFFAVLFVQSDKGMAAMENKDILNYEIFNKETMKKGGQIRPLALPKYTLIRVVAVLKEKQELTEEKVKSTLNDIISQIRISDNPDAISIYLHESVDHVEGGAMPLAIADWWPKGHSLSPDNEANIMNKSTHEFEYNITLPVKIEESEVVTRLSESKRKNIYTAIVKSEDRADAEAESIYPTDANNIPMDKLSTYDWTSMFEKKFKKSDQLRKKYEKQIMEKYKLTEEEIDKIKTEALQENWPMPRM